MFRTALALIILFFLYSQLANANIGGKTDVVFLTNGDRVTGEVIRLEAGLLEFNTDTMGRTFIEWRFISEIISDKSHSVETVDGSRWLGQLRKPDEGDHILVNTVRGPIELAPEEVVAVWPVRATFWDRVELDASVGVDYAKSTDIANFILSVDFEHIGNDRLWEASLRNDITTQSDRPDQQRHELRISHQYLRPDQRFRAWFVGAESNDALGINLRLFAGGGIGKYFIKTNNTWFTLAGGLLATEENPDGAGREANLEALGSVRYRYFRFADPERSFDTTFSVFPSLTDRGRVRADLRTTFKLEFIKDLFWSMELYATHDSEPLSKDDLVEKTDWGVVSSVGWKY